MKPFLFLLLIIPASMASAQSGQRARTLFNAPADSITGGYMAFSSSGTTLFGEQAIFLGGRIGVGVGHRIAFGLAGHGLANPQRNPYYNTYRAEAGGNVPDDLAFRTGYGGLFVEPILADHRVLHVSFPITVGAGSAAYGYRTSSGRYYQTIRTDAQAFFFVEPSVEVELNILQALRLSLGGAYLYTSDIDLPATDPDVLRRFMLRVTLKAGQF